MTLLSRIEQVNRRHPWSHNDHYGSWVARQIAASGAGHVLDVGCGTGNLVARLREHATTVTGIEPDPTAERTAAARFAGDSTVTITETGFGGRGPHQRWNAITLVAVLHHLPLVPTLRELRAALAPGGRLVVIGCYREDGIADLITAIPAVMINPVVGLVKYPARAAAIPAHMAAPTNAAHETLADISGLRPTVSYPAPASDAVFSGATP